ncbi:MAG: beta-ketoacyl-ACP synthase II [Dehalococcoidia bacterium]|jgi:3-oxoacyl-[acyl-carrier-protein] synthase II|nr:beta-ketoacyl-ACP synthase II [Dehalococcoidia bacterium]MDW8009182.1 beta-ketoacyl-ACP synthase II [Chloroflexota bacterium]
MRREQRRRAVITGMGAITPLGNSVEEFWQGCLEGRSGIDYLTQFDASNYPARIAGEVKGFDPEDYMDRREARRMARFSQFAVAAARQAIEGAGLKLEREDRERIGVLLGVGIGGFPNVDEGMRTVIERGGMRLDPFFMAKMLPNMAAAHVAMQFGLKGYNNTVTTACAAATQAMGDALELIRSGRADVVITGGAEAALCELGLAGFAVMRALSTQNEPPQKASRPFDAKRDGFVAAEGAAIFVLESLEHALARGAPILAELAGYAATADAYHIVAPCADGDGAVRCMRLALADAGVAPDEVDYINAHGTSTPLNDAIETLAIKKVFGERAYRIPISSTKSMIGHCFGAAGAVESVAVVKSIEAGWVHPTVNYEYPDPECDLDYVPNQPRRADVRVALKNSFGFGGQNACLVFKRFEE